MTYVFDTTLVQVRQRERHVRHLQLGGHKDSWTEEEAPACPLRCLLSSKGRLVSRLFQRCYIILLEKYIRSYPPSYRAEGRVRRARVLQQLHDEELLLRRRRRRDRRLRIGRLPGLRVAPRRRRQEGRLRPRPQDSQEGGGRAGGSQVNKGLY